MKFFQIVLASSLLSFSAAPLWASSAVPVADLKNRSLEELMNLEVTSVTRSSKPMTRTPAAVFVVTKEDIRRTGVRTLPEVLRFVPGMQVAQMTSSQWAISARGFSNATSDKLLVMIDGRAVYTPLFSGVYWDIQDVVMEDVERIEVIRGPGGSVWGENAVNGVINVITKHARDTQGGMLVAGGGKENSAFGSLRYGGEINEDAHYRVFGKAFSRDESYRGHDQWEMGHGGFRADWQAGDADTHTLQGDYYNGNKEAVAVHTNLAAPFTTYVLDDTFLEGQNVLYRWTRPLGDGSESILQTYYDETQRTDVNFKEIRRTLDVDWQHRFAYWERHKLTWGLGYRLNADETEGSFVSFFDPSSTEKSLFSLFIQNETALTDELALTLGTKLEHNDFTGFEAQPTARLAWSPAQDRTLWAAVSRAVRTPSRLDHELQLRGWLVQGSALGEAVGDPTRASEDVIAWEAGWRERPLETLWLDFAVFFNQYDNLRTLTQGATYTSQFGFPMTTFFVDDQMKGETYGAELAAKWQIVPAWRVHVSYAFLEMQLHSQNAFGSPEAAEGRDPENQFTIRSSHDLPHGLEFDVWARYVDSLPASNIDSYTEMGVRLGWQATDNLELSVVGTNLLNDHHLEFLSTGITETSGSPEPERTVFGKVKWEF